MSIGAPTVVVFHWVQQLTLAPYNRGRANSPLRRGPRRLKVGLAALVLRRDFWVLDTAGPTDVQQVTALLPEPTCSRYGRMAITCTVQPQDETARLVIKFDIEKKDGLQHTVFRQLLAWGDLLVMRRQLLRLRRLAERDAALWRSGM
ncbi:hypothetical protein [Kitasatospora sp. GAS204B]|uniref:hypothetical protein n=1 Tax=unclassified Kitasatospora TaxID=2633591 RepID=UPI002473A528|nr:hypothetical protein [Kitasatospora sp. GAS204B]